MTKRTFKIAALAVGIAAAAGIIAYVAIEDAKSDALPSLQFQAREEEPSVPQDELEAWCRRINHLSPCCPLYDAKLAAYSSDKTPLSRKHLAIGCRRDLRRCISGDKPSDSCPLNLRVRSEQSSGK